MVFNYRKTRALPIVIGVLTLILCFALWKGGAVAVARDALLGMLAYIEAHKSFGALLFVLLFAISVSFLLPASLITMAAGVIFKPVALGVLLVLLGSQLGLMISLVLGQTVLRPWVENYKQKSPFLRSLDVALAREGFKIVLLIRFSPIMPFGVANYMFSVTSISMPLLQFATFCGNIPGAVAYTLLGSYIGNLSGISDGSGNEGGDTGGKDDFSPRTKAFAALFSGVAAIWTVVYIGVVAKGALRLATSRHSGGLVADGEDGLDDVQVVSQPEVAATPARSVGMGPRRSMDLEIGEAETGALMAVEAANESLSASLTSVVDSRRRVARSSMDSITSPLSIEDVGDADDDVDANGYTAADRLLLKRTGWGLGVLTTAGVVGIMEFV
ncbi:snare associated Golgi protein-domain-containing protein [Chytriomyces sp. MP71]|nr:snare associated Golgi protein-domain-containing protein [Chytriomyces sp. MP71]